jgi:hypothetical protein
LILTAAGYTSTVATPASAEQVCSVQYPSGTPQMLGQLLGPDPPDSGTSTLPVRTQKYPQFKSFGCHVQIFKTVVFWVMAMHMVTNILTKPAASIFGKDTPPVLYNQL